MLEEASAKAVSGNDCEKKERNMPNIIEITDFHAPELDIYARYTEGQL